MSHLIIGSTVRIVPEYCECDVECNCDARYYFTVNNKKGYGSAEWVEEIQTNDLSLCGNFLGLPFTSTGHCDMVKQVTNILNRFREAIDTADIYEVIK